jgi:hypothetical protein
MLKQPTDLLRYGLAGLSIKIKNHNPRPHFQELPRGGRT